jgi:nitroreductase
MGEFVMNTQEVIKNRRSIRKYSDRVPSEEDIQKILEAGVWAPSGINNQPWKFVVVKDKEAREGLSQFTITHYQKIITGAPISICVFLDKVEMYNREKDILAIGACIQNMLLGAYEMGLGTCWLGEILNRKEEVAKYLNISSDYELMAVVTLGYSSQGKKEGKRRGVKSFILKF